MPDTQTVTLARQATTRELDPVESDERGDENCDRPDAARGHDGLDFASEEQFAPALIGIGTRAPASIYDPNPYDP